jgi:hypothetical protein
MKALLLIRLLPYECASLPPIQPADADRQALIGDSCRSHFLQGRWQLVHTISLHLGGGRQAVFTGVIVLSSADASIHCVLMTLEGFVLFEAVDDGRVSVNRAFGPFKNDNFAKGVMADIRFLFLEPEGRIVAAGQYEDRNHGCRFQTFRDRIVDVVQLAGGGWRLQQFDQSGDPLRTVIANAPDINGVSDRLELESGGRHAYNLSMILVEAIALK